MARNYEMADQEFWSVAESALRVRYDEAVLEVKMGTGGAPHVATVSRVRGTEGWRSGDEHEAWFITAEDVEASEVVRTLLEKCRSHVLRANFSRMLSALPYREARRLEQLAQLVLEARHTVVLSSSRTTREEIANNIKSVKHSELVEEHVSEILDGIKEGDITSADDLATRLDEIEVVYTGDALDVLRSSNNDGAYWDTMGEEAPNWSAVAAHALQADVRAALSFDPNDVHTVDCPRCGSVVSTESEDDETDCPKCGIDLSTEVLDGFYEPGNDPNDSTAVCQSCADDREKVDAAAALAPIPAETEFDCAVCQSHFLTLTLTPKAI